MSRVGNSRQLQSVFSFILIYAESHNPLELWQAHRPEMMDEFLHRGMSEIDVEQAALSHISVLTEPSLKT